MSSFCRAAGRGASARSLGLVLGLKEKPAVGRICMFITFISATAPLLLF